MRDWPTTEIRAIRLERLDERFHRYRLVTPQASQEMVRSLVRYGQISPVVVCELDDSLVVIDGFKRLGAARSLRGFTQLQARLIEADEKSAKAAVYALNRVGRPPQELEEAWIVQALVREDGLSQVDVADLLGHHKSWVCRRLALIEKLCDTGREELQLGLITPTMARQLTRLPAGNQSEVLAAARRESLTTDELRCVVDLLLSSGTREKTEYVLHKPRQAIQQSQGPLVRSWDPRLSSNGNRVNKQLAATSDQLSRLETWLRHRGRGELALCDRRILQPGFERLRDQARTIVELTHEFLLEIREEPADERGTTQ